jgi:predicted lipoprotein with Yx(FWY)xxD motif
MSKRTLIRVYGVGAGALVVAAAIAAVALASGSQAAAVGSATSSKLGESVLVSPQGRTLYALNPETSRHLLCKSAQCLHAWPPLTVKSHAVKPKAVAGVQGALGLLHRSNGTWQVTLRGMPLYRFSGDHGKAEANGDGLQSFGGTWHAVTASASAGSKPTTQTVPMTPSEPYATSAPAPAAAPAPTTSTSAPSTPTTPTTTTPTTPTYTYPAY